MGLGRWANGIGISGRRAMRKCGSCCAGLHVRLVLMSDNHFDLGAMAHQEMLAEGFHPDFPAAVVQQVRALQAQPAATNGASGPGTNGQVRDLRSLLWSSIDNDTSRDLDQAAVAE